MAGRRRILPEDPVRMGPMLPGQALRLAVPAFTGVDLVSWATTHGAEIRENLDRYGAVLFRGFGMNDAAQLEVVSRVLCNQLVGYMERRSPRVSVGGDVFTSTIYPPDQYIHFHNEKSYAHEWPMQLHFCCVKAVEEGGRTPLADSRRVYERLTSGTRQRFIERGVRYVRFFDDRFGLSWQETFQTSSQLELEQFCADAGIHCEWRADGRLCTSQDRHAVAVHPRTGETVWFNQAHYFHRRALPESVGNAVNACDGEGHLMQESFYGDGGVIADETIDEILEAYRAEEMSFPWMRGDLLVLDNMLIAHARTPFLGERLILLTLGDAYTPKHTEAGKAC
jgi:alpha-ketoglutarate-dependent taurine dioxygenase